MKDNCKTDIILRKDQIICDTGNGISLKEFILKVVQEMNISSGGSGSSTSSLFVSASDQVGTAKEFTLPNSTEPLIIKSNRSDIIVTRVGNQIIIGSPPAACQPVATPTIDTFSLNVTELEIGDTLTSITPTFTKSTPSGSPTTDPGVEPCPSPVASTLSSFSLSGNSQTLTNVVSGVSRTLSPTLQFTAPGQTSVFTLTGTGTKSDGTSVTVTSTATITAKFKVFSGYVRTTTSPGSITTSNLTASSLKTSISGTYGNTGHPGTGECFFYFAIPSALNISTAMLGSFGFSFLSTSDSGNGYTGTDTYNGTDVTYIKTITYNGINYALYRSNNSTLAAFGNISIT